MVNFSFGTWIRRRRKALDLTQQELALRVGCSSSLIFKIEADQRRPSRQIADLLARHLEIPPEQHSRFIKVARQEKAVDMLDALPHPPGIEPASPTEPPESRLPNPPIPLIGRKNELEIVVKQLMDESCRLFTITGPGGVGKTRLAIEVAQQVKSTFADGVYFLRLAGISSPDSIAPAAAEILGAGFSGPVDPKINLITFLQNRQILLVLDNFEHLLAGGKLLAEILEQAPGVKMLLTSREPVHLQWEWTFTLQGLPIPESNDPAVMDSSSAVTLFIQRARQAVQGFSPQVTDLPAIAQICQLVDGLPLAIELAAPWVRSMSCQEIALELEKDLDFLETIMVDVPARHRSIRAAFNHSWELLSAEERSVLRKLAVFRNGFRRPAAESVAAASLFLLSSLIDKSLLRYDKKTGRYDLHELIRQYALVELKEQAGEERETLEKHSRYYARFIADSEALLKSEQQMQTSALIHTETANWQSAWHWAVQHQSLPLLRQMVPTLYWYYEVHGYYVEALAAYRSTVNELQRAGMPENLQTPAERSSFAILLDQLAWFDFRTGNIERAGVLFSESLRLAQSFNDPEVLYYIYGNWGYMALLNGDLGQAEDLIRKTLLMAEPLDSKWHTAIPTNVMGILAYRSGDFVQAYQQLRENLALWRQVGDPRGMIFCMLYLGATALASGNLEEAKSVLLESSTIARKKMDRWVEAFGLDLLGQIDTLEGRYPEALKAYTQSLKLSQEIEDRWGSMQTIIHLEEARARSGCKEEVERHFLNVYLNARNSKWVPTILEVLFAHVSITEATPAEVKLAILESILDHPAIPPQVLARAGQLKEMLEAALTPGQIQAAAAQAEQKNAELWAEEIFLRRSAPDTSNTP